MFLLISLGLCVLFVFFTVFNVYSYFSEHLQGTRLQGPRDKMELLNHAKGLFFSAKSSILSKFHLKKTCVGKSFL